MSEILWSRTLPPRIRSGTVTRPRLLIRLTEGLARNLILVSAPAGYGKSTLVASWLAELGDDVYPVWLSLEAENSERERFLACLAATVERVLPHLVEPIQVVMDAADNDADVFNPTTPHRLTPLLNALAALDRHLVLVLDDYHVVGDCTIHRLLSFLISHLPETVTVVMLTRVDPPLPLARLGTRGKLTSVRAADLCFSLPEAAEFLRSVMRLNLSEQEIETLIRRTEGWISGLQLAALSLQAEQDVSAFLQEFAGDDRNIRSYLVEEVLAAQPPEIRQFLLVTSILERLSAPLCAALLREKAREEDTGDSFSPATAQQVLEYLEERNLFVVPLDGHREWYRYHTLFAELLRFQLWCEQRDNLPVLHRRAALWLEEHGDWEGAIRQALALRDTALAEAIRVRSGKARINGRLAFWLSRFKQRPLKLLQQPEASTVPANGHQFARGEYEQPDPSGRVLQTKSTTVQRESLAPELLPEPLSQREAEVLALLASGCSYREIGERLFISLPTVKTHVSHIYGKLGVNCREAALARAGELGILLVE